MDVPSAVLALVLGETAVGGMALLWFGPTWGKVRHGYEILLGGTLALMAWGAWGALRTPLATVAADPSVADAATWASRTLAAAAVLAALAVAALALRVAPGLARALGGLGTVAGAASFVPLAVLRAADGSAAGGVAQGVLELLLGAFLLGAVWDGMVLGHWYLVERRLSNRYMVWIAWTNVAAVVAGLGAVALSARNPAPCVGAAAGPIAGCGLFSPILSIGSMTIVMGVGVLALVALIAGFNVRLAREGGRSIQASTGMFYLAVILAPAAEFAAKVRYF